MPKIPRPVTDLDASRAGDTVTLRFAPPTHNTDGSRIGRPVTYEIHRADLAPGSELATAFEEHALLLRVIPPDAAAAFLEGGRLNLPFELKTRGSGAATAYFAVRVLNPRGREAGFSNLAAIGLRPAPPAPAELGAEVTEAGIRLRWAPVGAEHFGGKQPGAGPTDDVLVGYRIFRRAGEAGEFAPLAATPPSSALVSEFTDRSVEWGEVYTYRLRTVAWIGAERLEGADSEPVAILAEDTFPPAPPQRLVAVGGPERIDLSWDASQSPDVAGYVVHRLRDAEEDPILRPLEPLLTLTYTDTEVEPGVEYTYTVTAVDRAGNESDHSNTASATAIRFEDDADETKERKNERQALLPV